MFVTALNIARLDSWLSLSGAIQSHLEVTLLSGYRCDSQFVPIGISPPMAHEQNCEWGNKPRPVIVQVNRRLARLERGWATCGLFPRFAAVSSEIQSGGCESSGVFPGTAIAKNEETN